MFAPNCIALIGRREYEAESALSKRRATSLLLPSRRGGIGHCRRCPGACDARAEHEITSRLRQDRAGHLTGRLLDHDVPRPPADLDLFAVEHDPATASADGRD